MIARYRGFHPEPSDQLTYFNGVNQIATFANQMNFIKIMEEFIVPFGDHFLKFLIVARDNFSPHFYNAIVKNKFEIRRKNIRRQKTNKCNSSIL